MEAPSPPPTNRSRSAAPARSAAAGAGAAVDADEAAPEKPVVAAARPRRRVGTEGHCPPPFR
uniref:Uncharacterized protein n=1 Tax=Oryza rufipogon TaxID=4529 RepID=A0A0E0PHV5_ORYRU